jgi:predicted metalloprotease with PDZ domain
MKRSTRFLGIALMALGMFGALVASESYKKCPYDTQTCLDMMVSKMKGRGWLGIEWDTETSLVQRVVPGSPAESAGFKVGDLLDSVAGAKFSKNTEAKCVTCDATKDKWKPGVRIAYVVKRKGKTVKLNPTLAALPTDVMAQMIGMHMIEHAQPESAPKK